MGSTLNYNLTKPENGSSNWGDAVNTNFDVIDGELNANKTAINNHLDDGTAKHLANQIKTANGLNVESELETLKTTKASVNHTHDYALSTHNHNANSVLCTDVLGKTNVDEALLELNAQKASVSHSHSGFSLVTHQHDASGIASSAITGQSNVEQGLSFLNSRFTEIAEFLNYVNPDITGASLIIEKSFLPGGIIFEAAVDPEVLIRRFNLRLYDENENQIASRYSTNGNVVFVDGNFPTGQVLAVEGNVIVGQSKLISYPRTHFTYRRPGNHLLSFDITPTGGSITITHENILEKLLLKGQGFLVSPDLIVQAVEVGNNTHYPPTINYMLTNNIQHLKAFDILNVKDGVDYKITVNLKLIKDQK